MAAASPSSPRLFYALWPHARDAMRLAQRQEGLSGRKTHPDDFHLTLAFLGMQAAASLPLLEDALRGLSLPDLDCVLDTYGRFPRLDLVWAGMTEPPAALFALQAALCDALEQARVAFRRETAFRPHITLARKTGPAPLGRFTPFTWRPERIVLARSGGGGPGPGRYVALAARNMPVGGGRPV